MQLQVWSRGSARTEEGGGRQRPADGDPTLDPCAGCQTSASTFCSTISARKPTMVAKALDSR